MRVRSFFAPTAREALLQARHEMGDEARILTTRSSARGIELVVAEPPRAARSGQDGLREELRTLRERLYQIESPVPESLRDLDRRLRVAGVSGELRNVVLASAAPHRGTFAFDAAANALASQFSTLPPRATSTGGPRFVALVGPTGVGKTTTLAKLAGRLVQGGRRVALCTLDTYRIGAVEQLRAYAEMLHCELKVIFSAADLVAATDEFRHCDAVLVDTTGRSPMDATRLGELAATLRAASHLETLFVASAAHSLDAQRAAAAEYQCTRPTGMIITKLDETAHVGPAFSVAHELRIPLAFLCAGQEVPGDIEKATGARAAHFMLRSDAVAIAS
jgi:flagellar biosynthesis protein FlhF